MAQGDGLRKPVKWPTPSNWASLKPFGIGEQRPNNFAEVFRAAWENRDQAAYAMRILEDGVCDGCALGTKGLEDWTLDGIHLCNIRLRLLRLNTMGPLDASALSDVSALERMRGDELRRLGRIPHPLSAGPGMRASSASGGTRRSTWAPRRSASPARSGPAFTSPPAGCRTSRINARRRPRARSAPTQSTTQRAYVTRPPPSA